MSGDTRFSARQWRKICAVPGGGYLTQTVRLSTFVSRRHRVSSARQTGTPDEQGSSRPGLDEWPERETSVEVLADGDTRAGGLAGHPNQGRATRDGDIGRQRWAGWRPNP